MRLPSIPSMAFAICLVAAAQSATADVKSGVDAWSGGDYEKAVKEWRDPAKKGDADAQFNLGQAYKLGRGVKQDLDVAASWYQRAAKQGHLQASDSLGHLYHYQGKVKEALPLLEASSARGEPRSQYLLATELFNGVYISKDWVRAYALMTRASAAGLAPATRSLGEMDKHIPLDQRQKGVAMAGEIETSVAKVRAAQVTGFPINTKPPAAVALTVDVPPSQKASERVVPGFPGVIPAMSEEKTTTASSPVSSNKQAAKVAGSWRIQLGAFSSETNGRKLWNTLQSKVGGLKGVSNYLVPAGNISRLQAGPFANRTDADAMCVKIKAEISSQPCFVVAP